MSYRYGEYRDGPDPLAPPYDVRSALDQMGDAVLSGSNPGHALRDLLKQGLPGAENRRGLDDLLREVRRRRRELRERGRLDGTLERARALLETALDQERNELMGVPGDLPRASTVPIRRTRRRECVFRSSTASRRTPRARSRS